MSTPAISHGVPESILAAMRATNAIFDTELVNTGNFELLDKVYTADATILPPGGAMTQGRVAIKEFWKGAIAAMGVTAAKLATVRVEMTGDSIVEIGEAELKVGDGSTVTVKYVVHWKQEDGAWKWHVDIWNLNS
jgi:ketosteroid isomerase-like protein